MTHPAFRAKLEAVGFGAFIPFFFVSTGMSLDVRSLVEEPATLARVPIFFGALLVVRALPALIYAPLAGRPAQLVAAGLLQATSLSIPVVARAIGVQLGVIRPANFAALVAAGCSRSCSSRCSRSPASADVDPRTPHPSSVSRR